MYGSGSEKGTTTVVFYVNGTVVNVHNTFIPTAAMKMIFSSGADTNTNVREMVVGSIKNVWLPLQSLNGR